MDLYRDVKNQIFLPIFTVKTKMPIPLKKREELKTLTKAYFLKYAEENGHGTQYDFSKIPIRIHQRNTTESYVVIIESPEDDVFYAPKNIVYRDKAFIEIINGKVITENPYDASAPMWYDEKNFNIKKVGIYPGIKYFTKPLAQLKTSIIKNNSSIDLKKYSTIDWIISNEDIVQLFSKRGIFYEIDEHLICMILFKVNPNTNKHYRLQVYYQIKKGMIQNVSIIDTTPPPALC